MSSKLEKMSILDIANALGVSKSTVSRVISGKGRIGAETTERIQKFIQENNYRPNSIAKSFSESKTYNIGVVLPHDRHLLEIPFFQACLLGISQEITNQDYDAIVITVDENDISNLKRIVENHKVDGIILTRLLVNDPQIEYLKEAEMPFLVIGATEDSNVSFIDSDNKSACYALTRSLIETGVKKIGLLLGNQAYVVNQNRFTGFKDAMIENHLSVEASNVIFDLNDNADIDHAVEALLQKDLDLILCGDDFICSRALNYLDFHDLKVPKDIKVASFYNSQTLENHFPPTTVADFDILEVGKQAGNAMIQMIKGKDIQSELIQNYKVMLRGSTE